ncbi:MAG: septum formation protein Maf [Chloroflexi bacterium]|nr:septum formation protein Maf [Chloroflexota bacterium]
MAHDLKLASASPRRSDLLQLTGLSVEILPSEIEEILDDGEEPLAFARRLALQKARKAVEKSGQKGLIIAADTIVLDGDRVLGKPKDEEHAEQMLLHLRGRNHTVITAIAIIDVASGGETVDHCVTEVPMRNSSREEIRTYVATGDPLDKAGAYAIQNIDFKPVIAEDMQGCYANVMGLPLCHLTRTLRKFGVHPKNDVVQQCREYTNYDCQVYPAILNSTQ